MKKIEIKYIAIDKLLQHKDNPRKISERELEKLMNSIQYNKEYFEARPIIVNPQMEIIAGNMRFLASQKLGLLEVPVAILDVSEDKQKEIMIRDNRQNGEWDFSKLADNFLDEDLLDWGFEKNELGIGKERKGVVEVEFQAMVDDKSFVKFEYSHEDYLKVLELIESVLIKSKFQTKEEMLLDYLSKYE